MLVKVDGFAFPFPSLCFAFCSACHLSGWQGVGTLKSGSLEAFDVIGPPPFLRFFPILSLLAPENKCESSSYPFPSPHTTHSHHNSPLLPRASLRLACLCCIHSSSSFLFLLFVAAGANSDCLRSMATPKPTVCCVVVPLRGGLICGIL